MTHFLSYDLIKGAMTGEIKNNKILIIESTRIIKSLKKNNVRVGIDSHLNTMTPELL